MLQSYCKFLKLTNGEEIIVTTDNDCRDFKNNKYLSVMDAVEVKAMQMVRGPHIVETQIMQPWIKIAKDDIIQIPTDSILIAVDVEDTITLGLELGILHRIFGTQTYIGSICCPGSFGGHKLGSTILILLLFGIGVGLNQLSR